MICPFKKRAAYYFVAYMTGNDGGSTTRGHRVFTSNKDPGAACRWITEKIEETTGRAITITQFNRIK